MDGQDAGAKSGSEGVEFGGAGVRESCGDGEGDVRY